MMEQNCALVENLHEPVVDALEIAIEFVDDGLHDFPPV
jgi:hypothetical protein